MIGFLLFYSSLETSPVVSDPALGLLSFALRRKIYLLRSPHFVQLCFRLWRWTRIFWMVSSSRPFQRMRIPELLLHGNHLKFLLNASKRRGINFFFNYSYKNVGILVGRKQILRLNAFTKLTGFHLIFQRELNNRAVAILCENPSHSNKTWANRNRM